MIYFRVRYKTLFDKFSSQIYDAIRYIFEPDIKRYLIYFRVKYKTLFDIFSSQIYDAI